MRVVLTDAAISDLATIGRYIARDSPERARTFTEELLDCCQQIAETPKAFPLVPRYESRGIRRRVYRNYLIFYRLVRDRVEVLHVLHGAQDYEPILFPGR